MGSTTVNPQTPLLEIRHLQVAYFMQDQIIKAIDGIDLDLAEGEILGLVGESGSGKTTLAYALMGVLPPQGQLVGGTIKYRGVDTRIFSDSYRWKEIALVFQGSMNALNPLLSVGQQIGEVLSVHLKLHKKTRIKRIGELLEMVQLEPHHVDSYPYQLSGGMRQRVMIAMALACNPGILIADEPTSNLDSVTQRKIITLFSDLKQELGLSMIIISHDLALIAHLCSRIALIDAGKIIETGDRVDIFERSRHPRTRKLIDSVLRMNQNDR